LEINSTPSSKEYFSFVINSRNLTIRFVAGEIEGITYRDAPDGAMYPMDQIIAIEKEVKGFNWQPALRPIGWREMIGLKD